VALIPEDYLHGLQGHGRHQAFRAVKRAKALNLFFPDEAAEARLVAVASSLGQLWKQTAGLDAGRARHEALKFLGQNPTADPWVKSACYEFILGQSIMLGEFPGDLVRKMEKDSLHSTRAFAWAADMVRAQDPAWAARLEGRVHSKEPGHGR
jgi:hypothetical protein